MIDGNWFEESPNMNNPRSATITFLQHSVRHFLISLRATILDVVIFMMFSVCDNTYRWYFYQLRREEHH